MNSKGTSSSWTSQGSPLQRGRTRGRMRGRSRGTSPATAAGRHEAAATRTIRRRSRLTPAPSGGAQEGRPRELQGKAASQ
eukprot:13262396-Heterocapsa_arctica.AAC.1